MTFSRAIRSESARLRLEKLLTRRLESTTPAEKQAVDGQIWSLFGEKWAVMFTDLSGFSRQVEAFGIIHFLEVIFESQRLFVPLIEEYGGFLVKEEGDSLMVIFRQPEQAFHCALAMQKCLQEYNENRPPETQVLLCIGLGYGDILRIGTEDIFGAEVNAASKLGEDTAKAGEILVTESVQEALGTALNCEKLDISPPGAERAYRVLY